MLGGLFLPRFSAVLTMSSRRAGVYDLSLSTNGASFARPSAVATASASFSIEPYFDLISLPTSWRRSSFLFDAASRRALTVSLSSSRLGDRPMTDDHAVDQLLLALVLVLLPGEGDFFVAMVVCSFGALSAMSYCDGGGHGHTAHRRRRSS